MPVRRRAFEIAAIVIAMLLLGVLLWRLDGAQNMTLATGQPLFGDFIAFWSAGRATLDGHVEMIHDRAFLFAYQQAVAPDVRFVAPWNSPPTFLLIACVLALAPYPVSAIAFFLATLALFAWAMRRVLPDARALLFPLTAPAVLYQAGTVQVGLLITGLTGLALHWLDTRPRLAGALVALLAIKPHLALLWPLMLALSGRWRAFQAAALATLAFAGVAALVFGVDAYARFFENLMASQRLISAQTITTPAYASLYANLLGLGAPEAAAMGAHALSAAAALLIASFVFYGGALPFPPRQGRVSRTQFATGGAASPNAESMALPPHPSPSATPSPGGEGMRIQGAALCAATLLMSPYLFFYDFTLLLLGAALLGAPRDRFELAAAVLAWGAGLSVAVGYFAPLPVSALAAWLVLLAAFRRAGNVAPRSAPAPRT